jgi:chloramphenicol O-acetyltransferase type A
VEFVDLEKWPRKTHFRFFEQAAYPYIDVSVQTDVTRFVPYVKERGGKIFPGMLYCFTKAVNEIEEFRYRILDGKVVKYDRIHVNITVPIAGDRFALCRVEYRENPHDFLKGVEAAKEEAMKQTGFEKDEHFDVLWVSCNPWFSFTSMSAPIADRKMRSIPLLLLGKYFEAGGKILLPLSLKVNHALIDGIHIGKLLDHFENSFKNPEKIFG